MSASSHQSLPLGNGTAQCQASWHPAAEIKAAKPQELKELVIDNKETSRYANFIFCFLYTRNGIYA